MFLSIFAGILGLLIPVLLIAGVAYLIVRPKGTHREKVTIHDALAAYFYGVFGACVITTVVGVVMFVDVALKESTAPQGDEISLASVLVGTGVSVGLVHALGRVLMQKRSNRVFVGVRRLYLFCMLGIMSLAGLVSLPLAIQSIVKHYMVEHPQYYHNTFPSTETAVAIVVVPLWCWYIFRAVRETGARGNGSAASVNEALEGQD